MGYATDRMIVYDNQGAFLCELGPEEVFSRLRVEQINDEHELTIVTSHVLTVGTRVLTQDGTGKWREDVVYRADEAHQRGEHAIGTYVAMWSLQYDLMSVAPTRPLEDQPQPGMGSACTAAAAVRAALEDTDRWQAGTVDVGPVAAGKGCVMLGKTAWERLGLVVERWGGEVDATIDVDGTGVVARSVDLLAHQGSNDVTRRFDWSHDLLEIHRIPDEGPYYCRVIPYGRGRREWAEDDETEIDWPVDISEETGGRTWIQDDEAALAFRKPDGNGGWEYPTKVVHYDEDDPELLYNRASGELHDHTRPGVRYEGDVLQFARAGMEVHGVALGDDVQCVDRGFNPGAALRIQGRVMRTEVDELSPKTTTRLTIGELAPNLADTLTDLVGRSTADISATVRHIDRGGTIVYVDELLDALNAEVNATGGYVYFDNAQGEGLITYDTAVADPLVATEASKVTQIKGGSLRIASTKKPAFAGIDDWNWRTLITDGHITTELVTSAQIVAGYIRDAAQNLVIDLDNGTMEFKRGVIRSADGRSVWNLTASSFTVVDADVTGKITATTGTIGGYTITSTDISNDVVRLYSSGIQLKLNGSDVGKIGTNYIAGQTTKRGLVFDLDYGGSYMAWSARTSPNADYDMKLMYCSGSITVGNTTYAADTLHALCDLRARANLRADGTLYVGGSSDLHGHLDMNGYRVSNALLDLVTGGPYDSSTNQWGVSNTINVGNGVSLTFKRGVLTSWAYV